jgi:four helix bundle protein
MARSLQASGAVAGARHFRDLICWQLSNALKLALYELADSPQVQRDLRFRDQLRDAAASAPRNIAEGFGRRTHREFAQFLDIARGSLMECQNHLQDAVDRRYLPVESYTPLDILAKRACGAVARLQRYLRSGSSR